MTGYVNAKNIALTAVNINNVSPNSTVRTAISYGYKYLGTRFILGGSSITNGIDCATFTKQIYEAAYIGNNLMINASGHYGKTYPEGGITIKRIVYGNRRPALYKRLYGID